MIDLPETGHLQTKLNQQDTRRKQLLPERIFVSPEAREDALTQKVLKKLQDTEVVYLESREDPLRESSPLAATWDEAQRISMGKRWMLLTRYPGEWIKGCPGTLSHVCCNLWVLNPAEGCPLDCTYCCLQHYFRRNPTLKLFTNTDDMMAEISYKTRREPNRLFRICTGELTDSLALDSLTDLSLDLVPLFARLKNAILELKTKDSFIGNLLALKNEHKGKTVVSWSVNAPQVSENDEALAAPLEERVNSAQFVAEAGYRLGFHFDPLVYYPGWQDGYIETIRLIFSRIDPKDIAWISIAPLRYHPEQQGIMLKRFPKSKLPYGEHFLAKDNKLRIFQPIRFKMLRFIWNELKLIKRDLPVYMCMESTAAWRSITGGAPIAGEELREVFSRAGK